jgi:hypothetical protein
VIASYWSSAETKQHACGTLAIVHVSRHVRIAEALELEIVAVLGVDESIMQRARDVA